MTQITFYILQNSKVSTQEALLLFICQLCQTAFSKSELGLVVIDDNVSRLEQLNKQLWSFAATSFLPHDSFVQSSIEQFFASVAPIRLIADASWLLANNAQPPFDGVVLNLSVKPLPLLDLTNNTTDASMLNGLSVCMPHRLLEIIIDNEADKEIGRTKYRHYQRRGYQPQHNIL